MAGLALVDLGRPSHQTLICYFATPLERPILSITNLPRRADVAQYLESDCERGRSDSQSIICVLKYNQGVADDEPNIPVNDTQAGLICATSLIIIVLPWQIWTVHPCGSGIYFNARLGCGYVPEGVLGSNPYRSS